MLCKKFLFIYISRFPFNPNWLFKKRKSIIQFIINQCCRKHNSKCCFLCYVPGGVGGVLDQSLGIGEPLRV